MRGQLLKCSAFDADQLKKLDEAFEEVWPAPGLADT
jgi:hypothetical protein